MKTISAYFDGNAVKTVDEYKFQKNQRLLITVLDDKTEGRESDEEEIAHRLSLLEGLQKYRGRLSEDFDAEKELAQAREQKYSECTAP